MKENLSTFLLQSRRKSLKIAPDLEKIIRGSIVMVERACGKPSCMCRRGMKHRSMYISQSYKGKTRMTFIPTRLEKNALEFVDNYRKLKIVIDRVSEYNIMLLTSLKKHPKERKRI